MAVNSKESSPFWNATTRRYPAPHNCGKFMAQGRKPMECRPPYCDYVHFTEEKPWGALPKGDFFENPQVKSVKKLWWMKLLQLQAEGYNISVPIQPPETIGKINGTVSNAMAQS
jgi:hypothetical protein